MTAKEFLSYPEKLRKEIACDADHLAALRAIVSDCTSHLSHAGGHSNPDSRRDRFENIVTEITEEQAHLDEKVRLLAEAEKDALDVIRLVPSAESRSYLMMRFVKGMTPKEIGQEVHVGRATVFRMQRDALQAADCVLQQREHGGRADE
jgi:DNA-directed RNA polymerase specialized sigma subunit